MRIPNGMEVIFNNGGPDIPGVIEEQTPPNPALKPYIRVRSSRSANWLDPRHVRVMTLADHRRIFGKRFCDWQYTLWYTLIFHFAQNFQTLEREQLATFWQAGWSEAATAKHLAAVQGWECLRPDAYSSAPVYARPFIADLGYTPGSKHPFRKPYL
jgi:hypothetical protein